MSTVKITDLPVISQLNADTANTIFVGVDLPTDITGRISASVLAEGLYENKALKVGLPDIIFPNVIAQFAGSGSPYLQVNAQNTDRNNSVDYVATADIGTNANNFIDMGMNNSSYNDPNFSAQKALDGYLYVHGSVDSSSDGNLIIGTASAGANVVFAVGGQRVANVVATISRFGLSMNGASYIKFADGSIQSVAAAPASLSQGAYNTANSASANTIITQGVDATQNTRLNSIETVDVAQNSAITIIQGVDLTQNTRLNSIETINTNQNTSISIIEGVNLTQNTNITTANNHAWAAFTKANNALANTSGAIFAGNLNIAGNLTTIGIAATGQLTVNTALASATESAVRITGSNNAVVIEPQNDGYMLQITGKPNLPTRVVLDSFGANTYGLLAGRSARGSASAPTATQSGDVLLRLAGNGYGTTGFAPLGVSRIDIVASQNFTDAARGSRIEFYNVPDGSNTVTQIAAFNANTVEFTGTVAPQKGFIYSPTILVGNQTAFTIDYSTTSLIKATLVADLTISHSNYVAGKVVEVWLTNTGGPARTVTHGCTATNSTTNSTTFTMSGTSSAYLRYFSIDSDNANTFVTIQYA